jgi:hypothetical protein
VAYPRAVDDAGNSSNLKYTAADIERTIFEQGDSFGHAYSMHPTVIRVLPRTDGGRLFDLFTVSPEFKPNIDAKHLQPVHCDTKDRNVWIWPFMNQRTADWLNLFADAVRSAQRKDASALAGLVVMQEAGDGISMCLAPGGTGDCPEYNDAKKKWHVPTNHARLGFFAPIFTMNKQRFDKVSVLTPDFEFINSNGYTHLHQEIDALDAATPFAARKSVVFWRSSATGHGPPAHTDRARAANLSKQEFAAGRTWLDVKFTNLLGNEKALKPLKLEVAPGVGMGQQLNAKYLLDLDGNGNAWSGCWWKLLTTESVAFKVDCGREQWYYPKLMPWVHFVPVACDLSDLKLRFEWAEAHPAECQAMAKASAAIVRPMNRASEMKELARALQRLAAERYRDPFTHLASPAWLQQLRATGGWANLTPLMLQQHSEHRPNKVGVGGGCTIEAAQFTILESHFEKDNPRAETRVSKESTGECSLVSALFSLFLFVLLSKPLTLAPCLLLCQVPYDKYLDCNDNGGDRCELVCK